MHHVGRKALAAAAQAGTGVDAAHVGGGPAQHDRVQTDREFVGRAKRTGILGRARQTVARIDIDQIATGDGKQCGNILGKMRVEVRIVATNVEAGERVGIE